MSRPRRGARHRWSPRAPLPAGRRRAIVAGGFATGAAALALLLAGAPRAQPPAGSGATGTIRGAATSTAGGAPTGAQTTTGAQTVAIARGRELFVDACSSCHGLQATGIRDRGPSLIGVGAAAADFYLSTGRMPLADPDQEPQRSKPAFSRARIAALDAYIGSLGGSVIPAVDPAAGSVGRGLALFTLHCAGCHQVAGAGGIATNLIAPALNDASPRQIAEAVRVGPYVMPRFGPTVISQNDLNSIARYVLDTTHRPPDVGGWGIGHIGPIPEGMVAWLLAGTSLVLVARLLGERSE